MIELKERPKSPVIIEGFPGLGFVSTIATEFLIKHLDAKRIGKISSKKISPVIAIHNSEVVEPIEIYYDKQHNLVILRALTNITGAEWEIAENITELSQKLKAKEIIGLEGVASQKARKEPQAYYFTNLKKNKFESIKLENLKNGIVVGVTGVLLLKKTDLPLSCIFVETSPALPDSRAAGEIIKVLDEYLGLKVDYKPLIKTAEEFESKLKNLMSQAKKTAEHKEKKEVSYLG